MNIILSVLLHGQFFDVYRDIWYGQSIHMQALFVVTPSDPHLQIASDVLRNGKPVFIGENK